MNMLSLLILSYERMWLFQGWADAGLKLEWGWLHLIDGLDCAFCICIYNKTKLSDEFCQ